MACGQSTHQRKKFKGSMKENCNACEKNIYSSIILNLAIYNVFGWRLLRVQGSFADTCVFFPPLTVREEVTGHRWVCLSMAFSQIPASWGSCILVSSSLRMPCHFPFCSYHSFLSKRVRIANVGVSVCVSLASSHLVWWGRSVWKPRIRSWSLGCLLTERRSAGGP